MVCHWLTSEKATATPKPTLRARVRAAVRQVEGRVRIFVHSALTVRLITVARAGRAWVLG